ncbi:MAG: cation transporter, partial [Candidatus Eremiobacteraeota bacterium]|nr:cation transporter [Candidatus Eremiobacteraeota bacterium]
MNRLVLALALTAGVAALEFWGGYRAHSLALTTDAVHVCMDVFALALALAASFGSMRPANPRKTFGYGRLEILGAVVNGAILLSVTLFITYEAVQRFYQPHQSQGVMMSAVAGVGFVVNVLVATTLSHQARENLNVRSALYHILGDALGAAAVILGGAVIVVTSATWIDPLLSLLIAGIIIAGVVHVLREATDVLLEGVPRGMHPKNVTDEMQKISGVV